MQRFADKTTYGQVRDILKYSSRSVARLGQGLTVGSKVGQTITTGLAAAGYGAAKTGAKKAYEYSKEKYVDYLKDRPAFWDETKNAYKEYEKAVEVNKNFRALEAEGKEVYQIGEETYSAKRVSQFRRLSEVEKAKKAAGVLWHSPIGTAAGSVGMSLATYGLMGFAEDNAMNAASDRAVGYTKNLTAGLVDAGSDIALRSAGVMIEGAAISAATATGMTGLAMAGTAASFAFTGYALLANVFGVDPGTLAKNALDKVDDMYEEAKTGKKFNLTENTSMALQRQLTNLHASGSNIAEMMHN